jgi:CHAD domain-containing protein
VLIDEVAGDAPRALVVQHRTGVRSDLRVPAPDRPRTTTDLPSSLRQRVGDVVGARTLVEMGHERVEVWPLRLLDDEGKTVAGVDVERVESTNGSPAVVRVQLRTVRGYERDARRLHTMLDSQADLRPADDPMVTAVREAGREPGVEPGPSPLVLEPSMPAHVALATVFGHLLEALVAYEDGVQHRIDPEFLHHFRITVRRTRSAVRLAKKHLPRETTETWEPEWDWLAGITSAPRDLDVLLDEIASVRSTIEGELDGAGDAKIGLDELAEHVEMKRAKAQRKLERALAGDRYGTLKRGWRVAVDELRRPAGTAAFADDSTATALARELVRRAANQLVRHARDITSDSPATAIHDLRKRTKRLRYAVELFDQVLPPDEARTVIKRTKRMQDDLGEFQDNDVHHRLVSGLLESSSPLSPEAVEIGHELISRFDKRHDEARARLAGEIERFGSAMASVEL